MVLHVPALDDHVDNDASDTDDSDFVDVGTLRASNVIV